MLIKQTDSIALFDLHSRLLEKNSCYSIYWSISDAVELIFDGFSNSVTNDFSPLLAPGKLDKYYDDLQNGELILRDLNSDEKKNVCL